jgi:hypothetical protein
MGREALLSSHLHLGRATHEDDNRGNQYPRGGGNDGWPAQPRPPNRTREPGGRPTGPENQAATQQDPTRRLLFRHRLPAPTRRGTAPAPAPVQGGMSPTAVAPVPSLTRESLHRAGSSLEEGEMDPVPELTMVLLTAATGRRSSRGGGGGPRARAGGRRAGGRRAAAARLRRWPGGVGLSSGQRWLAARRSARDGAASGVARGAASGVAARAGWRASGMVARRSALGGGGRARCARAGGRRRVQALVGSRKGDRKRDARG